MRKYYPWKSLTLKSWLAFEIREGRSLHELESELGIAQETLRGWLSLSSQAITLDHLDKIAHYLGMEFDAVVQWLGICSLHLDQLIAAGRPGQPRGGLSGSCPPLTGLFAAPVPQATAPTVATAAFSGAALSPAGSLR